jgi:hypothetical protein
MAGFSEFLINNMKSSLAPEDLKLFNRFSKTPSANKTELSPIRAERSEDNLDVRNLEQQDTDNSSQEEVNNGSTSDDSTSTKYDSIKKSKPTARHSYEINNSCRYQTISDKLKESVKKRSNKVNTFTKVDHKKKNIKNVTYDKSWKNLANKYDEQSPKKTVKSPERILKNFMTRTLEKTRTIVVNQEYREKTVKLESQSLQNKLSDSDATASNVSKKVTTNPIYLSDSHIKKESDKETSHQNSAGHLTMSQRFSSINIYDLKPINASFSVMDNLDVKNFNEQDNKNDYYEEELNHLDDKDNNYNKLKYEEITTKKRTVNNSSNKKSLQPTVKFEINQLLAENDCKVLKNLEMKNTNEIENENENDDDDGEEEEYELDKHLSELHMNSGLFKALKVLKVVFNKSQMKKSASSNENSPSISSVKLKKKRRKMRNAPSSSTNGTIRVNGKLTANLSSKRKQILKKRVSCKKNSSSIHLSKRSKVTKSNQKLNMRDEEANIYSNNIFLNHQESKSKNVPPVVTSLPSTKNSKPESNYKYRSKLNPNSINLTPCNDQLGNPKNVRNSNSNNNNSSLSSLANSSNTTPLNNLDKCKLKNKEKLLSNWDKVIKKASNDPQSLKQLLKTNSEKALEESKKLKSSTKLSKEEIVDKQSHTSILEKINNKIQQSKSNKKKEEPKEATKPEMFDKDEDLLEKNADKRINEMLLNAKTAGKQGELIKNLFSYLNNYGDDGFTIKANLTSQSTPFVKSEVIFNNKLNSPSVEKPDNNNCQSSKSLLSASSSASSINDKNANKLDPSSTNSTPLSDQENKKLKNNPKSNFPYYLKCCVDKKPGPGSTIGSRCSEMANFCPSNKMNTPMPAPKHKLIESAPPLTKNNADDKKKPIDMSNLKKDKNFLLDIDQLIDQLEGDGQVELLKKKLSLYIKSKNNINSTSTISQDFTSDAASSTTISLNKKEIPNQIENKKIINENNLNANFTKLNINGANQILESNKKCNDDNSEVIFN